MTRLDLRHATLALVWGLQAPVLIYVAFQLPTAHHLSDWLWPNGALMAVTLIWINRALSNARQIGAPLEGAR